MAAPAGGWLAIRECDAADALLAGTMAPVTVRQVGIWVGWAR